MQNAFSPFLNVSKLESPEEEEAQLKNRLHQIGLWAHLQGIVLTNDSCGGAQPTVGSTVPGQVVLHCVRKQVEQAMGSKSVSSTPPWYLSQLLS